MKILFLNLADPGILGEKAVKSLEKKHRHSFWGKKKITFLNLMAVAATYADTNTLELDERTQKKLQCWFNHRKQDDKIIIAAHGAIDDTEYCYAQLDSEEIFKTKRLLHYSQLAGFVHLLITHKNNAIPFNITLSICYGARSETYEKNHITDINELDIQSSFAAKLYASLLPFHTIRMKATTGSVEFNEKTGSLLTEHEEAIIAQKSYDNLLQIFRNFEKETVNPLVNKLIEENGKEAWFKFLQQDQSHNTSPLANAMREFNQMEESLRQLRIKKLGKSKNYGKIVFTYDIPSETVIILLQHQGQERKLKQIPRSEFLSPYEYDEGEGALKLDLCMQ
ncbi:MULTISPECIES: hypothetical protein [unclassified Legionella]|uniref:hypothetical protein n=1 Tax=unclassified Legionella TaxID=2622702 RepID=UPI0010545F28|nr:MULTISPECIES: hypothetical protein [unclassified Legionella]MDI9818577.1 hypothetical protein [Legionella sp. PL877]